MKCRDCEKWGWGDDEGTPVWGWCWKYTSCPDPDIDRSCPDFSLKKPDIFTTLSTLQAENKKLRAELNDLRTQWDMYGGDEGITSTFAELEQTKAEIARLKHYEDKCHDCPIVCAKTEIIKAHEELEAAQNERDMWKEGMEDCQQSILELEAELEQVKRCIEIVENQRDQMKRERDAAIDCIYKIEDALDRGNDNDWAREHISEWKSQKED